MTDGLPQYGETVETITVEACRKWRGMPWLGRRNEHQDSQSTYDHRGPLLVYRLLIRMSTRGGTAVSD